MEDLPDLDRERGLLACGGNRDLHAQVADLLAADLDDRLAALQRAAEAGDLSGAGRLAHKHKGACLAVGAARLAALFAAADQAARGGDRSGLRAHLDQLAEAAVAFRRSLKS